MRVAGSRVGVIRERGDISEAGRRGGLGDEGGIVGAVIGEGGDIGESGGEVVRGSDGGGDLEGVVAQLMDRVADGTGLVLEQWEWHDCVVRCQRGLGTGRRGGGGNLAGPPIAQ